MTAKRKRRTHGRARASARRARSAAVVQTPSPLGLRLRAGRSMLLIVDVHERLVPALSAAEGVLAQCVNLLRAAAMLHVPIVLTEHCPGQLGPTVAPLKALVAPHSILAKTHFCAVDEPSVIERIRGLNRPQVVIAGMEAHVCVMQTALGLAEKGYRPHVVADATGSRREASHTLALARLRAAGIAVVSTEMVVFEWLEHAERPEFRDLLALVK